MNDNVYTGPSESETIVAEQVERPSTMRLPAPARRPSGPRQALRPAQIHVQPVRSENSISADASLDPDMKQTEHSDSNTSAISIDPSCLDALDDQLLVSPIDSFVDVCWAEAVGDHDPQLGAASDLPTLYNATMQAPKKAFDDYEDLDPFAIENEKWDGDGDVTVISEVVEKEQEPQKLLETHPAIPTQPSLAYWEPRFTIPNPNDTVHGFPSRPPKSRRMRRINMLASACSRFPGRLVKSAT